MFRKLPFLFFIFFLIACGSAPQPAPTVSNEILLRALATSTSPPTATSTAMPPTITPEPTTDPNFFRDDFDQALNAQWTWVREDPRNWSLSTLPGFLQINASRGHIAAHTNSNLLLRPAPAEDFQIETQITFRPKANFQFAGLIIYESDSNFIQAGRAYCSSVGCVGEGLYMDYYKKGIAVKPDFGQTYKEIDPIFLRLTRKGNSYTFEASPDRKVWFLIGSHTSDMLPLQVGLNSFAELFNRLEVADFLQKISDQGSDNNTAGIPEVK